VITSLIGRLPFLVVGEHHNHGTIDAVGWEPSTASKAVIRLISHKAYPRTLCT